MKEVDVVDEDHPVTLSADEITVALDGAELRYGVDYIVSYENNTAEGTATAIVTGLGQYGYSGSASAEFEIRVSGGSEVTATGIAVKTAPTKNVYTEGETLDPSGLVLTVSYSDGSTADVAYSDETAGSFTFTPGLDTALEAGNVTVTVGYAGFEAMFDIRVDEEEPVEPGGDISTAVLEYAIEIAEGISTDGVVDAVKENFENALQAAKDVLARVQEGDTTVTQSDVDTAWSNLIKAMQYLEFKKGDKTDLEKVIALADEINNNLDSYLDAGKDAFTTALAEAKEIYADGNAMQDDVDAAWRALMNAMAELRLRPSKDLLEDLINQAEGLNEADYEAESFAAVRSALAAAKDVFANEEATPEEVDTSVSALEDALAKLTPVSTGGDNGQTGTGNDGQTGGSSNSGNSSSSNTSGSKAVKTGDTANALPFAVAAAVAVAAAAGVIVLKKKEDK